MKILYLITKSEAGGAQTHVAQLAEFMKEKGHDVAIMAGAESADDRGVFCNSGVEFYPNPYLQNSFNPLLGMKVVKEIRWCVDNFEPDLVHCHSSVAGVWGRWALRRTKQFRSKPAVIFTAHGWAFTEGVSRLRRLVAVWAERISARFCQKIICVSDYDRILALGYEVAKFQKLVTVHNGVEVEKEIKIQETRGKQIPNNKSQVSIVFVGRLSGQKDPELLLEAFSELPDDVKGKVQVKIVGDGEKRKSLENFVKENNLNRGVEFLGDLPRKKVFDVLGDSDTFVLTSHYEGFPITILEAMSLGLPVVASDVGGVKEVVDGSVGYLVDSRRKKSGNGKDQLKKALVQLIENPILRQEKGRKARERIEKKFSLDKMLNTTYGVYEEVLGQRTNS